MLTWETVEAIRAEWAVGSSRKVLAAKYSVHQTQIWNIVTGRSWKSARPFKTWRDKKPRYEIDPATNCWNWLGFKNKDGYGIKHDGKHLQCAHRWMWQQSGRIIPVNHEIDHLCRNRACVNPDHLEPVAHIENCRRGSRTKLTPEDWNVIRILYRDTEMSQELIGAIFGVRQAVISKIVLKVRGY